MDQNQLPVSVLNIAAGRREPLFLERLVPGSIIVNIDRSYLYSDEIGEIVHIHEDFESGLTDPMKITSYSYKCDIYEFLQRYHFKFDMACAYRFLEHVPKDQVLYFIYLVADILKIGGLFEIIVPDYEILAKRILSENPFDDDFEENDIITTYELLNDPGDPHCSIWTEGRLRKFLTLEKRFEIRRIDRNFEYDGRDLYLRAVAKRI